LSDSTYHDTAVSNIFDPRVIYPVWMVWQFKILTIAFDTEVTSGVEDFWKLETSV
jgi:hypothetical protein